MPAANSQLADCLYLLNMLNDERLSAYQSLINSGMVIQQPLPTQSSVA